MEAAPTNTTASQTLAEQHVARASNPFAYSIPRRGANYALASLLLDLAFVITAFLSADFIVNLWLQQATVTTSPPILVLLCITWSVTALALSVYDTGRDYRLLSESRQVFLAVIFSVFILLGVFSLASIAITVELAAVFAVLTAGLVFFWRFFAYMSSYASAARKAMRPRRVLVVGISEMSKQLHNVVFNSPLSDMSIIGFVDHSGQKQSFLGLPVWADSGIDLFRRIRDEEVDEIIVALSHDDKEAYDDALRILQYAPLPVWVVPSYLSLGFPMGAQHLSDLPLTRLRQPVLSPSQRLVKRAFDITAAGAGMLLVLPVFIVISIVIKLTSPGPIFFIQDRMGQNGRPFKIYKFRSMVKDADNMADQVKIVDEHGNTIHKVKNDFRVTPIGKIIRKTSLDELPQLINVLRGDMSLVGPRPELVRIVEEEYDAWQYERFAAPQGITGWWQVNGRSDNPAHLSVDRDIYYIRNYSFWLDIKILLMTIPALLKGKGAF